MNVDPAAVLAKFNQRDTATRRVPSRITRRQLACTAAGTAALGGALGLGLFKSGLAKEASSTPIPSFAPVPIPGGSPALNGFYHVFGPASPLGDPIDAEPSSITNLNGFVGLATISGMVTRTNIKTGEKLRLPFLNSDMRFMKGDFRGTDGSIHKATFAFV
jgi:hypothetical protein